MISSQNSGFKQNRTVGSLVVRASDSRPEGMGSELDATKYPLSTHGGNHNDLVYRDAVTTQTDSFAHLPSAFTSLGIVQFASFLHASLLVFGWKRVAISSGRKEPKGYVNEKMREPVTICKTGIGDGPHNFEPQLSDEVR
ncbi:hypothetical protein TNCV_5008751 [Trichonephila clavipes]|nr:hypothetical protein TNCV_5008751 [Trichonephila clavipes]